MFLARHEIGTNDTLIMDTEIFNKINLAIKQNKFKTKWEVERLLKQVEKLESVTYQKLQKLWDIKKALNQELRKH